MSRQSDFIKNQINSENPFSVQPNIGSITNPIKEDSFLDTGETTHVKIEDYKDYIQDNREESAIPFKANLDLARALGQSNWEQAGNAALRIIPNTALEIVNQAAGLLDIEDYVNADNEVGNWLSRWATEQKQNIDEGTPIYQENPGEALQVGDFAWWMENGTNLVQSATAFAALGYATGGASLAAVTKGAKALKWLQTLGKTSQLGDAAKGAVQGVSAVMNSALLTHAEGYGVGVQVFDQAYREELGKLAEDTTLTDEQKDLKAKQEAARKAENAMNFNMLNVALNLSSAGLFLKRPKLATQALKNPSLAKTVKRIVGEGVQESGEELVNLAAEKTALSDDFSVDKIVDEVFTAEGAESALLGFLGGAMQTGLTTAGRELKLRRDVNGNRVSENTLLRQEVLSQEEAKQKWAGMSTAEKLTSVSDAYLTFQEQAKLYEDYHNAENESEKAEIGDKILYKQAYNAFNTGTTDQLLEVYKGIQGLTEEEAEAKGLDKDTYKEKSKEATALIRQLETEFTKAQGYRNSEEVYSNRAELISRRKENSELKEIEAEYEAQVHSDIIDLGLGDSIEEEQIKAVNDLPSYKQLIAIQNAISQNEARKKQLVNEYANITSDTYQDKVREKQLASKANRKRKIKQQTEAEQVKVEKNEKSAKVEKIKTEVPTEVTTPPVAAAPTITPKATKEDISINYNENGVPTSIKLPVEEKPIQDDINSFLQSDLPISQKLKHMKQGRDHIASTEEDTPAKKEYQAKLLNTINSIIDALTEQAFKQEQVGGTSESDGALKNAILDVAEQLEEENLSPATERREKSLAQHEAMLKVFDAMEEKGIDITDFEEVGRYFKAFLGTDRFIKLYVKIQALFNLVSKSQYANTQSYEELFLTEDEKKQLLADNKILAESSLPSHLYNLFLDNYTEELEARKKNEIKEQGYSVYNNDTITEGTILKIERGDNKLAHLDKNYKPSVTVNKSGTFNVLDFVVAKEDLDKKLNQNAAPPILNFREINVGSKIRLIPLESLAYNKNGEDVIVYRDGTVDTNGKITKENPALTAPIAVEYKGEIIKGAYLHVPDWITEDSVRGDVAKQKENLLKIRQAVLDSPNGVETTITYRSDGHDIVDPAGYVNKTNETMGETTLAIGKDNLFYTSKGKKKVLKNYPSFPGRLYALYPVNKGKMRATPLLPETLIAQPDFVNSIKEAIKLYLDNNTNDTRTIKLQSETGINITTLEGLAEYLNLFINVPQTSRNKANFEKYVSSISDQYPIIEISKYSLNFAIGTNIGNTITMLDREYINNIKDSEVRRKTIKEVLEKLDKVINRNLRINPVLNKLGKSFDLPVITNTDVQITSYDSYNDFIKENSYTNQYSYKLPDGTTIYTTQSSIEFDTKEILEPEVSEAAAEEIKGDNSIVSSVWKEKDEITINDIVQDDLSEGLDELIEQGVKKVFIVKINGVNERGTSAEVRIVTNEGAETSTVFLKPKQNINDIEVTSTDAIGFIESDDITKYDDDYAPRTLTENEEEEIKLNNPDSLHIQGIPIALQEVLVNHMYSEIIKRYVKQGKQDAHKYIREFKNILDNVIRIKTEEKVAINPQYQKQLDRINTILDNFTVLEQLTRDKLLTLNHLNTDSTTINKISEEGYLDTLELEETIEEESEDAFAQFADDAVFREDYRLKIGTQVRNLLSFIPEVNPDTLKPIKEIFNITKIIPLETVLNDVTAITAFNNGQFDTTSNPDIKSLIRLINEQAINKPYLYKVAEELENADKQTQNMFVRSMSKAYSAHKVGYFADGKLKFTGSDSNNLVSTIKKKWLSGLRSNLLIEKDNKIIINNKLFKELKEKVDFISEDIKTNPSDINAIADVFDTLGLNINKSVIADIDNKGIRINGELHKLIHVFNNSDGFIKLYMQILSNLKGVDLREDHPFRDFSNLTEFARQIAKLSNAYYAHSFKDVRGRNYFAYVKNNFIIDRLKRFRTDAKLPELLRRQPFTANSYMLDKMQEDNNIKYYTYSVLDGVRSTGLGKKFPELSDIGQEQFKVSLFFSQNQFRSAKNPDAPYIVNTFYPTTSDKSVVHTFSSVGLDVKRYLTLDGQISKKLMDIIYPSLVKPEILRILDAQSNPEKYNYEGAKEGSRMFIMFPELNDMKELYIEGTNILKDITANQELERKVREYLTKFIINEVDKRVEKWREAGLSTFSEEVQVVNNTPVNTNTEVLTITNQPILAEAYNYEINNLLANMGVFQLFTTDVANYWKSNQWKKVRNEDGEPLQKREDALPYYTKEDWVQEHLDTFDNMGKRLAADSAPGEDIPNSGTDFFNISHVADRELPSMFSKYFSSILNKKDAKSYMKINSTDAQELTTLEEHLNLMVNLGEIDATQKSKILTKEKEGTLKRKDFKVIFGSSLVLNPMKPRYVENIWDADNIERRIYIKSSSFPLIKQLTKGLQIDKIREAMDNDIQRIVFASALKIGGNPDMYSLFDNDGNVRSLEVVKDILQLGKIENLPRTGTKIQQQMPYKEDKSTITNPTQLSALITSTVRQLKGFSALGKTMTGKQVQEEINERYARIFKTKYEELGKELDYDIKTNTLNINKLKNILREEGIKRNYPLYDLMAFDVENGKFAVPLWATGVSSKIQSMLNSIVDNRVRKHKPRGASFILGSSAGFKSNTTILEDDEAAKVIKNTDGIIYDEQWLKGNPTKALRPMRIEGGQVKPAEVMAPFRIYDAEGNKLNLEDYTNKETGLLDASKIDSKVLEMLGFRIPTQGLKSMSYIKIVGFLPENSGDLILTPDEFVTQMGSDFDIDKLYSLMYNTVISKDKLIVRTEGEKIAKWDNEILDLYMSILKHPDVQPQIAAPMDYGMLNDLAKEVYPLTRNESSMNGLTEEYQSFKYNNARIGKEAIGIFSNDMRLMANLADSGIYWTTKKGKPIGFKIGGLTSTFLTNPYGNSKKLKANVIEAFQSLAVDNEKEQGLHKLGITQEVFPFIRAMALSGMTEDIIIYTLNQPIIKRYIKLLQEAADINSSIKKHEIDNIIRGEFPSYTDSLEKERPLNLFTNIKLEDLKQQIGKSGTDVNNEMQRTILDLFSYLTSKGGELQRIQTSLNTFNKGVGKNIFYSVAKEQQILDIVNMEKTYNNLFSLVGDYINFSVNSPYTTLKGGNNYFADWNTAINDGKEEEFIDKMIAEGFYPLQKIKTVIDGQLRFRKNISFIRPTTIVGMASVYGTIFNNQIWNEHFPYNNGNLVNTIEELKSVKGIKSSSLESDAELSESTFNSVKSYLTTKALHTYTEGTIESERQRLFIDKKPEGEDKGNKSIATILHEIKSKGLLSNSFINRLDIDIRNGLLPSRITYKANVAETLYEREIYQVFNNMLLFKKPSGEYNGIEYTVGKLTQDLITSQLLSGGLQGSNQFLRYVPISYLKSIGFYDILTKDFSQSFNKEIIVEQTIQHSPELVYSEALDVSIQTGETQTTNDGREFTLNVPSINNKAYMSIIDSKATKGYRLYKRIERTKKYIQISTLGYNDYLEYSYNIPNAKSSIPNNNPIIDTGIREVPTPSTAEDFYNVAGPLDTNSEIIVEPTALTDIETRYNLESNDLSDILGSVINQTKNKSISFVGHILKVNLNKIADTRLIIDTNLKADASYNLNDKTIKINPDNFESPEEFEHTLIEEIIHAFTKKAIKDNNTGEVLRLKGFRNRAITAIKNSLYKEGNSFEEVEEMFNTVDRKIKNREPITKKEHLIYSVYNTEEFIGRLFRTKELQELLNNEKGEDGISLWEKFAKWIAGILADIGINIKQNSLLDYTVQDILSLLDNPTPITNEVKAELKKEKPIKRTVEFVEEKFGLRDENGQFIHIENAQEVADVINRDIDGIKAEVLHSNNNTQKHVQLFYESDLSPATATDSSNISSFRSNLHRRIKSLVDNIDRAKGANEFTKANILQSQLDVLLARAERVAKIKSLAPLLVQGEQDMEELKQIFDRGVTASDAIYIKEITDYWTNLDQLLFTKDDMYSTLIPDFKQIEIEARQWADKLQREEEKYVNKILKEYGKQTSVEEIFNYYRDINAIAGSTLDISRFNNPILNNLLIQLKEANQNALSDSQALLKDLKVKEKKVREALRSLGYKEEELFEIFRQKDKKGRNTNHLVQRYNLDYLLIRGRLKKSLIRNEDNSGAYKAFVEWNKKTAKQIDLLTLFPTANATVDKAKQKAYIASLKNEMGVNHFNEFYEEQSKKINRYNEQLKQFKEYLQVQHNAASYEELLNNPVAKKALTTWLNSNSPYYFYGHLKTRDLPLSKIRKYNNHESVVIVPKDTEHYDNNFKIIENNKDVYEFYKYYEQVNKELEALLPLKERINLMYYGIPYLPTLANNAYREKGYKAGLAPIKDAITRAITIEGESTEDINPINDRVYRKLGINLTKDNKMELDTHVALNTVEYQKKNKGEMPTAEIKEEWRRDKIHELSQKQSFDLPAVLRLYSLSTMTYSHKSKVEDYMKIIQNIFDRQKEIRRNSKGEVILKDNNEPDVKEASSSFKNSKAALDYASNVFYGITKQNEGTTTDKAYTTEEKATIKKLDDAILKLETLHASKSIDDDSFEIQKKTLEDLKNSIGGIKVWSKRGDLLLKVVQLKGMGWNFMSGIANIGFGWISNYLEAEGGLIYSRKSLDKAYKMTGHSVWRNATFNKATTPTAAKIRALMDNWDVLKDASKELFVDPYGLNISEKYKWAEPYNVTQRTEYVNQAPLMIALMLDKTFEHNGKTHTYWDAFNEKGKWDESKFGPEPKKEVVKLILKLDQVIKANHGNYDPVSALKIKDKFYGRAVSQFRTWMFEGVANRFEKEKYDDLFEEYRKGRYVTGWEVAREKGLQLPLMVLKGLIRNATFGKVFADSNFDSLVGDKFKNVDAANMRKLMMEINMYISLYTSYLILKALASGLDDEEDKYTKYALNLAINQGLRLKTDIVFYLNPSEFKNLLRDLLPVTSLITDVQQWGVAVRKLATGDDEIKSGVYSGHSRFVRETSQMLPFTSQIYKNINYGIQTFDKD